MNILPMLDVGASQVPQPFVLSVAAYCATHRGHADALGVAISFETEEGQRALKDIIDAHWPELGELAALTREIVALDPGCVVLRGLGYRRFPREVRDSLVLALTQTIGKPTDHNADKRVLWPVKPRDEQVKKTVDYKTTFSEEAGEAPLHTDSAFAHEPEKYNCLYVVKQAQDGGGISVVLNVPRLIEDLDRTPVGRDCLQILRQEEFPFRVPDAFFKGERVVTGRVLGNNVVRFRHDCLMAGFAVREDMRSNERLWAIEHFRSAAETSSTRISYQLQDDEAIVVDNHRLLHARTNFEDRERHLIRVRMHAA